MDNPDANGIIKKPASGEVRGGHDMLPGRDAERGLWWFDNSWGTGFGKDGRLPMMTLVLRR